MLHRLAVLVVLSSTIHLVPKFFGATIDGRLVFIAPETLQGAKVRLVIEPNASVNASSLSAHLLLNAYDTPEARTPYIRWINGGLLRYADKKMFPSVYAQSVGRQLPDTALQNKAGTGKILTTKICVAIMKSKA